MCTILEWLYENDRNTLVVMAAGECNNCKFEEECHRGNSRCYSNWLNAEYVEPYKPPENDSWDMVKQDSQRSIFDYCNEYLSHLDKSEYTTQNMCFDLVCRCECLIGAERNYNDN